MGHDLALSWLFRPLEQHNINLLTYLLYLHDLNLRHQPAAVLRSCLETLRHDLSIHPSTSRHQRCSDRAPWWHRPRPTSTRRHSRQSMGSERQPALRLQVSNTIGTSIYHIRQTSHTFLLLLLSRYCNNYTDRDLWSWMRIPRPTQYYSLGHLPKKIYSPRKTPQNKVPRHPGKKFRQPVPCKKCSSRKISPNKAPKYPPKHSPREKSSPAWIPAKHHQPRALNIWCHVED